MAKRKKKTEFKGIVNRPFKVRDVLYKIGDEYITPNEESFNKLIIKKFIK